MKHEKTQPIFAYVLDETDEIRKFIRKVADDRQKAVTRIRASAGAENDILPPVELWLKGFRDAELVVTNSFHGMMFSILNNTDFIIIGREAGGLPRIKDFLSEYDIDGRFVDEAELACYDVTKIKPIDWKSINKKLEKRRKESGEWLINSLQLDS